MNRSRKLVLLAVLALFVIWLSGNFGRLAGQQDGAIRFSLGLLFSLLILFRPKPKPDADKARQAGGLPPGLIAAGIGLVGAVLSVSGLVFHVNQFEWLGLVLIFYACLRWAMPPSCSRDVFLAMFLLYWLHPLPSQVFGKLQLGMQILSMRGAEWLLHALNVRVWADSLMLFTGARIFGVPEACSGMRTATTVLLITLGVCMLYRFKLLETLVFLILGLVQVLALNVLRITGMVMWGCRMDPGWSIDFLHDTLLVFLFIALALVQGEATWWKVFKARRRDWKRGIAAGEYERPDRGTTLPGFWRHVLKYGWILLVVLLVAGSVAAIVYKSRPSHRRTMRIEAIDGLMTSNPRVAERAIAQGLAGDPQNRDLLVKKARLLLGRQAYGEALEILDTLPGKLSVQESVLKSWAFMASDRIEEAAALIEALPRNVHDWPGVAMLRAEYAARKDRADVVVECLASAAHSYIEPRRIRSLFPYLASRRQWRAIAAADEDAPYDRFPIAMIAIHAHLMVNDAEHAAAALRNALKIWPDDPRLLNSIHRLALAQPHVDWDQDYRRVLEANLHTLDVDQLASYLDHGFRIGRPDLSWIIYRRLQALDPRDPALYLAPAEYAPYWFRFRNSALGTPEEAESTKMIDLKPLLSRGRGLPGLTGFAGEIPLADDLLASDPEELRDRYVAMAAAELERRQAAEALTPRLELTWPRILALQGQFDKAHAQLNVLADKYPDRKPQILLERASLYTRQTQWQDVYEVVVELRGEQPVTDFRTELLLINAMMNLNMPVCAMHVAEQAARRFPGNEQMAASIAAIWDVFGFKDHALFVVERAGIERQYLGIVQLIYDTGRFQAADRMAATLNAQRARERPDFEQPVSLPSAELAVAARWPEPLAAAEMATEADQLERAAAEAGSPFIAARERLIANWYRQGGAGDVSDPSIWRAAGRNTLEQVALLRRLAMLHARQGQHEQARPILESLLELMPDSAVLWRTLIAVTEGEAAVVKQAWRQCPDDPMIWLAWLVVREREAGAGDWAVEAVQAAIAGNRYPERTFVRAGDFFLRKDMLDAATLAVRHAEKQTEGYLPTRALAVRCAARRGDTSGAVAAAFAGAAEARNPAPFYQAIVAVKGAAGEKDADMVAAVEYLSKRFPDDTGWQEVLGHLHFDRGESQRAMTALMPVIGAQFGAISIRSLLVAAESARLQDRLNVAASILEAANEAYPRRVSILNNLIYVLAQRPETVSRARELLPSLLDLEHESYAVLDTAALTYMRSGDLQRARQYLDKALAVLDKSDYSSHEVRLHEAELFFRAKQYEEAKQKIIALRRVEGMTPLIDQRSMELLRAIESAR